MVLLTAWTPEAAVAGESVAGPTPTEQIRASSPTDAQLASASPEEQVRDQAIADGGAQRVAEATSALDPQGNILVKVMHDGDARRQIRNYWCGPATMQSIDGGDPQDTDGFDPQSDWAKTLGTTRDGTSLSSVNRAINRWTSWDDRATRYTAVSVKGWSTNRFYGAVTHQVGFLSAPWIQHPKLLAKYHHYVKYDHGGHLQVGRGYERNPDGSRFVHLLEPYNEPDWTSATQTTWGPRRISAFDALQANQANMKFRNIGI